MLLSALHSSILTFAGEPAGAAFWVQWVGRISRLEKAIICARDANVSVNRAKRLVKDMQAQAAAAEAAARLEEVLQHKPCGSGVLKVSYVHS
jgi:hypothetical protein